ncbi:thiamine phosphate synthase [Vibrio rhizosphaerae]|uniref:thiamine phosphate synthase n=1 Tax=Vibrio rhizosphaerae TaxID=398736 RepID=UPI0021C45A76|nr:thiamine phosphate synthase [Vibrio rhizosphaerae]
MAEQLTSVKVNLHRVLKLAQAAGLAKPDHHLQFDADPYRHGLCIHLEQGRFRTDRLNRLKGSRFAHGELSNHGVLLMTDEPQQIMISARQQVIQQHDLIQQHYHVRYCEQIQGCELTYDANHLQVQQGEQQTKVKAGMTAHIVVAFSPQSDAPHSELWRVGSNVYSLSSATFSTDLATSSELVTDILDLETDRAEDSQQSLMVQHLAWLIGSLIFDFPLADALVIARAAMNVSRETWPQDIHAFPAVSSTDVSMSDLHQSPCNIQSGMIPFKAIHRVDFSLYPVVDDVTWIEQLLRLGVKTVQLRIKDPQQPDLEQQIKQAILLGKRYQAQVFINDYWQLAIKHQAFGVHLGQEDLHTADIQALRHAGIRLGISTHGYWEILKAQQILPSYIALGHIFPTPTKQMPSLPQGLARLRLYQQLIDAIAQTQQREIPTVAIGGIDLDNAASVLAQGVTSVAVVRAVTQATNMGSAVDAFQQLFQLRKENFFARKTSFQCGEEDHVITR